MRSRRVSRRSIARSQAGDFEWNIADEDVHMAIERVLTERIGPAGARLHTGRSRNDQVATDTRLYAKRRAVDLAYRVQCVRRSLVKLAEDHFDVVMPGYTHLQKAQPVLFSHHLLAYAWMLTRDFTRVRHAHEAADVLALGSAALAGTTFASTVRTWPTGSGFSAVSENSMDCGERPGLPARPRLRVRGHARSTSRGSPRS